MTSMRRFLALVLPAAAAALLLVGSAAAKSSALTCGTVVTSNTTLASDLNCSGYSGDALGVGADNVTVNLNGHTITSDGSHAGVASGGYDGVTVQNGKITNAADAVDIEGSSNSSVKNLKIMNVETGVFGGGLDNFSVSNVSVTNATGTGIDVEDVDGASVTNFTTSNAKSGVFVGGVDNVTVANGAVDGSTDGAVEVEDFDGGSISNITVTNSEEGVGAIGGSGMTISGVKVAGNYTDGTGVVLADTENSKVTKANVDKMEWGIVIAQESDDSVSNSVSRSNVTNAEEALLNVGETSASSWTSNSVYDSEYGFDQFDGGYATDVSGNKIDYTQFGIYFDQEGAGPVSASKNTITRSYSVAIFAIGAFADICECPTDPGSTFTGNVAKGNYGNGFMDVEELNATWTGNNATGNAGEGFYFDFPWNATVTGNTSNSNGEAGFYFDDDDPGDAPPKTVANNSAKLNQEFGFYSVAPITGSGNMAKKNVPFDCFNVSCSGGAIIPTGPVTAPAKPTFKKPTNPAAPTLVHRAHR
jgi:hypothetical protein